MLIFFTLYVATYTCNRSMFRTFLLPELVHTLVITKKFSFLLKEMFCVKPSLVPRLPLLYLGEEGVWCIEQTFLSQPWNAGTGVGIQICKCQDINIIRIPREYRNTP